MITKEIAASMALRVYDADVEDYNLPADTVGWSRLPNPLPVTNGFAYGVFRNESTGEIVISYRGTDGAGGMMGWDGANNIGLYLGSSTSQAIQAAKVYSAVLQAYGADAAGSNISFTGHSLGGGLASLVAVLFNRPAFVFDPAPFQSVAENIYAVSTIRDSFGEFVPQALIDYDIASNFAIREAGVTSFHAAGEFLEGSRTAANTIYSVDTTMQFGNQYVGMFAMHSQALLTAGMLSDSFRQATVRVPYSLPIIMSGSFYSKEPEGSSEKNFLVDLIRSEQTDPGNGRLTWI